MSSQEQFDNPGVERARRFLSLYQPFILTVAAIAVVALLLPAKTNSPTTASDVSADAPQAAAGDLDSPTDTVSRADGDSQTPTRNVRTPTNVPQVTEVLDYEEARKQGVPLVANCDNETKRIRIPSFGAAACVPRFTGSNAGATYQGVTKDKIRVVVYQGQPNPAADAILTAAGASDSKQDSMQQVRDWVKLYERHFNTWGRKVELVFVDGSGAAEDDAAAKADAIKVATQIKAFASWGSPNNTYVDEVTARGVMCMCTVELPNALYQKWAPYVWSTLQSLDQTYQLLVEYIVKRLHNKPAKWAGDLTLQRKNRVLGLLQYDTADYAYKSGAEYLKRELTKRGVKLVVGYFNGYPDLAANQEQARPLIQRMKEAGVTSLICACDPFAPIFFTQEATRQVYRPEWLIIGSALTDTSFFGRTYDQDQWSHAFGLGQLVARLPERLSDSYRLYTWEYGHDPVARAGYGVIRAPIDIFYHGVHMAGPSLTPKSFETGLFSEPLIGANKKTVASISFGTGIWPFKDYTAFDDVTEMWWDRTARGEDEIGNNGVGLYRYVAGGKRYIPGQWPTSPPNVFNKAGTVTIHSDYPPGERPPSYPRPG
jgi:hypothetical protein